MHCLRKSYIRSKSAGYEGRCKLEARCWLLVDEVSEGFCETCEETGQNATSVRSEESEKGDETETSGDSDEREGSGKGNDTAVGEIKSRGEACRREVLHSREDRCLGRETYRREVLLRCAPGRIFMH